VSGYLVHVGYVLMLCALVARDVLWLRATLILAQLVLAAYAWTIAVWPIAAWNALFVAINVAWVLRLVHERRAVVLPERLDRLHRRHFAAMTAGEFLRFWEQGRSTRVTDARITVRGAYPASLFFLVSGRAVVSRDGAHVAELGPGQFAGEMSLITGAPASADVDVAGDADLHAWPIAVVHAIRDGQPALWIRLQAALGADLVEKIRRGDSLSP